MTGAIASYDGDRAGVDAYLKSIGRSYYVYVLCRPNGEPFYVGKGVGRRALAHEAEARLAHPIRESNPFKCNVIRKIVRDGGAVRYQIDSTYAHEDQVRCLEREAVLIARHRRLHEGGCLTNLAAGVGTVASAAPFSRERHAATLSGAPADNPARATLNRFLRGIGPVMSVPVKPINQMARILPTTPHPSFRRPTPRAAYALSASAAAHGIMIGDGAVIPRSFEFDGVPAVIENGVARDILKANMATLMGHSDPAQEAFHLSVEHTRAIIALVGRDALMLRGLL